MSQPEGAGPERPAAPRQERAATSDRQGAGPERPAAPRQERAATSELTGTALLTRFAVRRDRVRMLVWIFSIFLLVASTASSIKGLYPTQSDLDEAARTAMDSTASQALNGPALALDTYGGQVAFQIGAFGLIAVALMSVFTVGRLTRSEEESGRTELIRSMAVGRYAPAAAALIVATAMNVVLGGLVTLGLVGNDLPVAGSVAFGVGYVAIGLFFAALTTVAAQVTENTRVVYGMSGAVIGAAYAIRAAGDAGSGALSWLSPIGWSQKMRPYADEVWWPALIGVVLGAVLLVLAVELASRRDLGGGLVPPRPGPAVASPGLGRPLGLALRLQRGSVIAWSVGLLLTGVSYGSIGDEIDDLLGDSEATRDLIAQGGGSLADSYLSTTLLMMALMGAGFAIQSVLRLRGEENGLRAEPILATRVSRPRWVASHLAVALAGSVLVLLAAGVGLGVTYGLVTDDMGEAPRLIGAALAYTPAMWLLIGFTLTLFGLFPRAALAAWGALALCFLIGLLSDLLNLPTWVNDLSPFEHTPNVPAADLTVLPLVALLAVAAALTAVGLTGFRRRDLAGGA